MFSLFKRNPVKVQIVPATMDLRITARKVTQPSVRVTDPAFDARKYLHTNLADTFARAKAKRREKPRSAA